MNKTVEIKEYELNEGQIPTGKEITDNNLLEFSNIRNVSLKHYKTNGVDYYLVYSDNNYVGYIKGKENFDKIENKIKSLAKTWKNTNINIIKIQTQVKTKNLGKSVENNPKAPVSQKNIDFTRNNLSKYSIKVLAGLYKDAYTNSSLKKDIISNIKERIFDVNTSFEQKKEILKLFENTPIYNELLISILGSLKNQAEGDEFLHIVGKEKLQQAIKDHFIDDNFVEQFYINYNSSDRLRGYSVNCGENIDKDTCNAFSSYIVALGKTSNNPFFNYSVVGSTLSKAFDNNLSLFKEQILPVFDYYKKTKGKLLKNGVDENILKQKGLIGVIQNALDKTNMTEGQKQFWVSLAPLGLAVGAIFAMFKYFKKLGFLKGILGLVGGDFALEATTGESILGLVNKLVYGGFDMSSLTKKNQDKTKEITDGNKEYQNILGFPSFTNMIFGDDKLSSLGPYITYATDGTIKKFDVKKYINKLPDSDWRKAFLQQMGIKKVGTIFVKGLNQLGIKKSKFDRLKGEKINYIYDTYIDGVSKKKSKGQNISTPADTSTSVPYGNAEKFSDSTAKIVGGKNKKHTENEEIKKGNNEVLSNSPYRTIGYIKDGRNYIIGKDGTPKLFTFQQLSPEFKKRFKAYSELTNKINLFIFTIGAAKNDGWKLNNSIIKTSETKLVDILQKLSLGKISKIQANKEFDKIFIKVFGDNADTYDLKIYFDTLTGEKLRIKVLKFVRDNFNQYGMVTKDIVNSNFNKIFQGKEIKKINKKEKLLQYVYEQIEKGIKSGDYSYYYDLVDTLVAQGILSRKESSDIKKKVHDLLGKFNELLTPEKLNEGAKKLKISTDEYENLLKQRYIENGIKFIIFGAWVQPKVNSWGNVNNPNNLPKGVNVNEINLFSDIEGYGFWNVKDSNKDWINLIFQTAAIEVIAFVGAAFSMGGSEVAGNALVEALWLRRTAEVVEDVSKLSRTEELLNTIKMGDTVYKVSKFGKFSYFIGDTLLSGTGFYAGYGGIQSFFEGKNMYSWKGWGESIAFTGAFKALEGIESLLNIKLDLNKPLKEQKIRITSQLLLEGTTFSVLGLGFEGVLFEPGQWDAQTILQALAMVVMFKLAGISVEKIRFRKTGDKVEILDGSAADPIEFYKNPKTGTTYTKTLDGKWFNSEGTKLTNPPKDVVKMDKISIETKLSEINEKLENLKDERTNITEQINDLKNKKKNSKNIASEKTYNEKIKNLKIKLKKLEQKIDKFKNENDVLNNLLKKIVSNLGKKNTLKSNKTVFSKKVETEKLTKEKIIDTMLKNLKKGKEYDLGVGVKIGKSNEGEFYVEQNGEVTSFKDIKELKKYIEANNLENGLLMTKLLESIKEGKLEKKMFEKKKFADTNLYLGKKEIDFSGKIYKVAKGSDGKYYMVEKGDKGWKVGNKIELDKFIDDNPKFVEEIFINGFERFLKENNLLDKNIIPKGAKIPKGLKISNPFTGKKMLKFLKEKTGVGKALSSDQKFRSLIKLALTGDVKGLEGIKEAGFWKGGVKSIFLIWIWGYTLNNVVNDWGHSFSVVGDLTTGVAWNAFTTIMGIYEGGKTWYDHYEGSKTVSGGNGISSSNN